MSFDVEERLKKGNLKSVPLSLRDPGRVERQKARKKGTGPAKFVVQAAEEKKRSGIFAVIAGAAAAFLGRRR
jgi:hypothetical protein